jgi:transposase
LAHCDRRHRPQFRDKLILNLPTRHMRAVLKAQINKTDRNDARGIAQMMRVGLYRPVHVKTLRSQKPRMLLTHRKLLQSKAIAVDNDLRGTLRNFGLKVGIVGRVKFDKRIKELVEDLPDLVGLVQPLADECFVSRSASCTAGCWLSSGIVTCVGA